ncbi:branched-chain amino acid ABC transporter permease [Megasphaera stantonii]|nr:branched-chain amino acid ABC transporter permease [Megasphaera stantonii]
MINRLRKQDAVFLLAAVVVFAVLQFLMAERIVSSFWRLNISLICLNVMLASSLNLINGVTGQFSLGHAGFMAVGAYVSAVCTVFLHLPFVVSLIGGAAAAGLLGFLVGVPTLRLQGDYLAIATLGMGEIIRICILNIQQVGGASGMSGIPRDTTFPWLFFCMVVTLFVLKNIIHSKQGRACLAVRENAIAAEAMGIDTTAFKVFAFTIASMFAGLAGALFSHYFGIAHPSSFTFMRSFDIMTMVVLGGLGSLSGSVIGAFILTLIAAVMQSYPEYRMIVYALLLIILMLYRPNGILGNKELAELMLSKWKKGGRGDGPVAENK